jgi:RNA polymerase sigma factor for flagellar operon FliA
LENTAAQLQNTLGRPPSSDEVADALGMDLDTFYEFASAVQDVQRVELDAQPNDELHSIADQIPSDPGRAPDALLLAKETRACVRRAINDLPPDERIVMFLYYICDWRMEAIARRIHRTESRVSQIHSRALARLRQRLTWSLRDPVSHPVQHVGTKPVGVQ